MIALFLLFGNKLKTPKHFQLMYHIKKIKNRLLFTKSYTQVTSCYYSK